MQTAVAPEVDHAEETGQIDVDVPLFADLPPGGFGKVLPTLDVPTSAAVFAVSVGVVNASADEQFALLEDETAYADMNDVPIQRVYVDAPLKISRMAFKWFRSCPAIISVTRVTVSLPRSECMP